MVNMNTKEKSIYFCDITWDNNYPYRNKKLSTLVDIFNVYFENPSKYELSFSYKNKDMTIKLEEFTDDHIFGIYTYKSDFKREMARQIDNDGNIVGDTKYKLEYYSFFYIDITSCKLVYIYNNHLPDIRDFLPDFFKSKLELNMLYFQVTNIIDKNGAQRIATYNKLNIVFQLNNPESPVILKNVEDIDSYQLLNTEYRIKILKPNAWEKFLGNLLPFKKIRAEGKITLPDPNFVEEKKEVFNLLKNTFSRSAKINIDILDYDNTDQIHTHHITDNQGCCKL